MNEPRTVDSILERLQGAVESEGVLAPGHWIDAALALTALLGGEADRLFRMQQALAVKKSDLVKAGSTVASANLEVQGSDEWYEMKSLEAKIGRVEEMVRCAKIRARLADSELHS